MFIIQPAETVPWNKHDGQIKPSVLYPFWLPPPCLHHSAFSACSNGKPRPWSKSAVATSREHAVPPKRLHYHNNSYLQISISQLKLVHPYLYLRTPKTRFHLAKSKNSSAIKSPIIHHIIIIIIIIIIIYLSWSWATCWPVPVSRIQKSLQRSTMIPSASWGVVFHYPG